MAISYRPMFVLLASKGLKKTDLMNLADISSGTLARFAKSEPVSMDVIGKICKALNCQPGDLVEYILEEAEK
jgi:DNA-binding Xre family transcriptional regulator